VTRSRPNRSGRARHTWHSVLGRAGEDMAQDLVRLCGDPPVQGKAVALAYPHRINSHSTRASVLTVPAPLGG
jgi:hypothetical protein